MTIEELIDDEGELTLLMLGQRIGDIWVAIPRTCLDDNGGEVRADLDRTWAISNGELAVGLIYSEFSDWALIVRVGQGLGGCA